MTILKYKIGDFITSDYGTAVNRAKETGEELIKLYIYDRNCNLGFSKDNEEEVKNVSC